MGFSLSDSWNQIKDAGLETIEAIGEGAVAGVTGAIRGSTLPAANSDAQINNAPDIGMSGDGMRTLTSAPVSSQYSPPNFIQSMPTWAKVVGGVSAVMLVLGVGVLVARK